MEEASLADWRKTQAVNQESVFLGCRAVIRAMKEHGGSIINISSIEGIIGEASAAAYNASKGGVRIFTKSVGLHCGNQGYAIRANSVHPGLHGEAGGEPAGVTGRTIYHVGHFKTYSPAGRTSGCS